jgi:hypothetical protein
MAAMPEAQFGLLAEATKLMGELTCAPGAGEVTVTTGVVANAKEVSPKKIAGRLRRKYRIQKDLYGGLAARDLPGEYGMAEQGQPSG